MRFCAKWTPKSQLGDCRRDLLSAFTAETCVLIQWLMLLQFSISKKVEHGICLIELLWTSQLWSTQWSWYRARPRRRIEWSIKHPCCIGFARRGFLQGNPWELAVQLIELRKLWIKKPIKVRDWQWDRLPYPVDQSHLSQLVGWLDGELACWLNTSCFSSGTEKSFALHNAGVSQSKQSEFPNRKVASPRTAVCHHTRAHNTLTWSPSLA